MFLPRIFQFKSLVLVFTVFVISLSIATPAVAADISLKPELRVETGMHTSQIRRVVVDLQRNRLITCGDDKTIRIWQLPNMRLVHVLRVPLNASHEGQLYALALSPDSKVIAAAGWTAWDWDGKASIYLFDAESGALISKEGAFSNVVNALSWVANAKLAVGLQGQSGLHLLDLQSHQSTALDLDYADDITDIDLSKNGLVAVASLDSALRIYDSAFKLQQKKVIDVGKKQVAVKFSPNGQELAVAFIDTPNILILSAKNIQNSYPVNRRGLIHQTGFTSVAWSANGDELFAGGQAESQQLSPIFHWKDKGKSIPISYNVSQNRITEIQPMTSNHVVFVTEDPSIGIINHKGQVSAIKQSEISNFSQQAILLSADAADIQFSSTAYDALQSDAGVVNSARHFSITGDQDQSMAEVPKTPLYPPITQSAGLSISDWENGFSPKVNGIPLVLDEYEFSRSYAISPSGKQVLFGTEWAVRLFNTDARQIWHVDLPAVASSVNISRDGHFAVAALSDGTIRWFSMVDGKEVVALFPHKNKNEWILWMPDGYYASSLYGDEYIGWHLNRGVSATPDYYRAVQFERTLYRPDIVQANFKSVGAKTRGIHTIGFDIQQLDSIAPPSLSLTVLDVTHNQSLHYEVKLKVEGKKSTLPIQDFVIFVNDVPVTPSSSRQLKLEEKTRFERILSLELTQQNNRIRVESFNGQSMGVAETFVDLKDPPQVIEKQGNLYMVSIGANAFLNLPKKSQLSYAVNDAQQMLQAFNNPEMSVHNHIYSKEISDDALIKPNKQEITEALNFIEQAGPDDTVVVFLASHGISDSAGNYYFVPRDAKLEDVIHAQKGAKADSLISWNVFFDALRKTAGRRYMIVDTCNAANIEGRLETYALSKRSATSKFALILAAKGSEESQEYKPAKHGLFTYALLSSIQSSSDLNADKLLTLAELFEVATSIVEQLRYKKLGSQTPQLVSIPALSTTGLFKIQ